jgi:hypothetical protein
VTSFDVTQPNLPSSFATPKKTYTDRLLADFAKRVRLIRPQKSRQRSRLTPVRGGAGKSTAATSLRVSERSTTEDAKDGASTQSMPVPSPHPNLPGKNCELSAAVPGAPTPTARDQANFDFIHSSPQMQSVFEVSNEASHAYENNFLADIERRFYCLLGRPPPTQGDGGAVQTAHTAVSSKTNHRKIVSENEERSLIRSLQPLLY